VKDDQRFAVGMRTWARRESGSTGPPWSAAARPEGLPPGAQRENRSIRARQCSGPWPFVAVGQQQHETRLLAPLVLGGHQEDCRRMIWAPFQKSPNWASQATRSVRGFDRIAVLEADARVLGQQRVTDGERGRPLRPSRGTCSTPVSWSTSTGMAVGEGAAASVLAGHPHVGCLEQGATRRPVVSPPKRSQSRISPSATTLSRCTSCTGGPAWGGATKPSGTDRTTWPAGPTVSGSMPVSTRGMVRSAWITRPG